MSTPYGQAEPFTKEMVTKLRVLLKKEGRLRDLALFCVGIDSCLRASDLLSLHVSDVVTPQGKIRDVFFLKQMKTGHLVQCSLSKHSKSALEAYLNASELGEGALLFPGGARNNGGSLTRRHYSRLVDDWVALLRWAGAPFPEGHVATHSIRRSKTAYIYERTKDIIACQHLLGHSKPYVTDRYLGGSVKKAHKVAAENPF